MADAHNTVAGLYSAITDSLVAKEEIRHEWLGTSPSGFANNVTLQQKGELPLLIAQREQIATESRLSPYDPTPLLTLGYLNGKLGFSDITVGNSYRALILLNAAFNRTANACPPNLGDLVQNAISTRLKSQCVTRVGDEMLALRLQAYLHLINGLLECMAFWDGLKQIKVAMKLYPEDPQLVELRAKANDSLKGVAKHLPKGASAASKSLNLKMGKLFLRQYPWIDQQLFKRSPRLVRQLNEAIKGGSCEVRRAFFGQNVAEDANCVVGEDGDVGPLGIFATRDIEEGELILVDRSITGISNIPASYLLACDACLASLSFPFITPDAIVSPTCCNEVAYCSKLCHDRAVSGYHKVLCGKDFTWLFEKMEVGGEFRHWRRWRAISFLRMFAIIIADDEKLPDGTKMHPLSHPLLSRMTAAYAPSGTLQPRTVMDWQLHEDVTIPTKILQQLGVDIFACAEYSQEVIQTIYSRIENNANQTKIHLIKNQAPVHMVSINTTYLFFNHSCLPNVTWHGGPDGEADVTSLGGIDGELLRPGESAVWCLASKSIKKGEECKISYVGDALGEDGEEKGGRKVKRSMLEKWCANGCGCSVCEGENATEKAGMEEGGVSSEDSQGSVEASQL